MLRVVWARRAGARGVQAAVRRCLVSGDVVESSPSASAAASARRSLSARLASSSSSSTAGGGGAGGLSASGAGEAEPETVIRLPSDLSELAAINPELMEVMAAAERYAREAAARGRAARARAWEALVAEGVTARLPAGDALPSLRLVSSLSEAALADLARELEVPTQDELRKTAWVVHDALSEGVEGEGGAEAEAGAAGGAGAPAAPAAPAAPVRARPAGIRTTRDARNTQHALRAEAAAAGEGAGPGASAYPAAGLPTFAPEFAAGAPAGGDAASMSGRKSIVPRPGQQRRARAGRAAAPGAAPAPSPSAPPEHGATGADAARALADAGANDVVVLDVRGACPFADEIVVSEGRSQRVCRAAAGAVVGLLKQRRDDAIESIKRQLRKQGIEEGGDEEGGVVGGAEGTGGVVGGAEGAGGVVGGEEAGSGSSASAPSPPASAAAAATAVPALSALELEERLEALSAFVPQIEGQEDGTGWLVVDGGRVVCHVFTEEARKTFDLEGIWAKNDGENVTLRLDGGSNILTLRNIK